MLKLIKWTMMAILFSYNANHFTFAVENKVFSKKLVKFVEEVLVPFGKNPLIVDKVVAQNVKAVPLQTLKEINQKWLVTPGVDRFMLDLMSNDCAMELLNLESKYKFISRSLVIDNQGGLVCISEKTPEYWQGETSRFLESYKSGIGAVYYENLSYDEYEEEILTRVAFPIKKGEQAIGVVVLQINLDKWEKR